VLSPVIEEQPHDRKMYTLADFKAAEDENPIDWTTRRLNSAIVVMKRYELDEKDPFVESILKVFYQKREKKKY